MDSSDSESYAGSVASVAAIQESSETQVSQAIGRAFDPLPLDRAIIIEAQHSGMLNALTKDLLELKAEADLLCADLPNQLAQAQALLKKTDANVEWLTSRINSIATTVKRLNPIEFAQAESRIIYREEV